MGLGESELIDDDDSVGGKPLSSSNVACSICLELVAIDIERSYVKLVCGHEFHLDCIGSAFNSRGTMQCPNCRNIEKGQWLYASGGPVWDDPHDEEFYDLSYSEMSFGVRWCPFTFPQLPSSFDEGDFPSTAYGELSGQHGLFAEHAPVSSTTHPHPCPYFPYYGPIHSSPPNSGTSFSDSSYTNGNLYHRSSLSGPSEVASSYPLPVMDPHYHSWEHHSPPLPALTNQLVNSDQPSIQSITQRSTRANSDPSRHDFFLHPFLSGHGSRTRASTTAVIPTYPGSGGRTDDHAQALQAYLQPPPTRRPFPGRNPPTFRPFLSDGPHGTQRSSGHRSSTSLASSSDHSGRSYYVIPSNATHWNIPEAENQMLRNFHAWERDRLPSLFPPLNEAVASGTSGFRPPQGRLHGWD